jgi:hypothetical protein
MISGGPGGGRGEQGDAAESCEVIAELQNRSAGLDAMLSTKIALFSKVSEDFWAKNPFAFLS